MVPLLLAKFSVLLVFGSYLRIYVALGHIQITSSWEYVAEASSLAVWLGQTTAYAIFL